MLQHLTENEANWDSDARQLGSRVCVLNCYLFGRRGQVFLHTVVPLSYETSFLIARAHFSLKNAGMASP